NAAADRLTAFADLARRYPQARLIASGGSGLLLNQAEREDAATAATLVQMGVDPARVTFENQSRNTWENALFSRDLMQTEEGRRWVLVTSAFHMPRAAGVFRKLGIEPIPYPVDYRTRGYGEPWLRAELSANLDVLSTAAREWTGLAAYYLAGRLDEFFPAPR
ncbi:MAG TPA: YdcF family protein, partial [Azospirillaceae bacterium]|nr:YdcF family protein [Azospirillaceae bacterium]